MGRNISVAGIAAKENLYLVMHRLPGGAVGGLWEFPGGKVDPGETPEEALQREWQEETGFDIEVGGEVTRSSFVHKGQPVDLIAFRIALPPGADVPELREHDDWKWATLDEISGMPLVESDQAVLASLKDGS